MSFSTLRKLSKEKLNENFAVGVALTFVVILSYLCINATGKIASMFLNGVMVDNNLIGVMPEYSITGTLCTLIIVLTILSPLRLNIKRWYQGINGEYCSPVNAFSYFTSIKKYLSVLYFSLIHFFVIFLTFLLPILPSIGIMSVINYSFNSQSSKLDSPFGALTVLMLILLILGVIFSVIYSLGFFFADYIYIKGIATNPFKALLMSRRIARKNTAGIFRTIILLLPYYLICIFIIPIPFVMPKIKSGYAIYADKILNDYLGGQNVNIS